MSFLDATGLGTFWAKLKNYFLKKSDTDAPVTGLTDILTPMNLLPNAEFTQLGLYEATQTIASATVGTSYDILPNWKFQMYKSAASDVTITISRNSVRITGTVSSLETGAPQIRIYNSTSVKPNKYYTFSGHIKVHSTTITSYVINTTNSSFSGQSSGSTGGTNETEYTGLFIFADVDGSIGLGCCMRPGSTGTFDIEFSNMCLYEGEFKNPPVNVSTNTYPTTTLLTSYSPLGALYKNRNLGSITGPKWIRLCKLRSNSSDTSHYVKLIVSKSYTSNAPIIYTVEAMCMGTGTTLSSSVVPSLGIYAKGIAGGSENTTNRFTKFRFAKDTDNNIYIEGYYVNNKANVFYVNIELYCTNNITAYDPYSQIKSFSPDGTNDTLVGREYGYFLISDMSTYIAP